MRRQIFSDLVSRLLFMKLRIINTLFRISVALAVGLGLCLSAVQADSILYVSNNPGSNITEYNSSGSLIGTITSAGGFGLAVNSSGDLYALNWLNNTINEYNSSGSLIGTISDDGVPYGMAFNSSGDLYAANAVNNTITEYNSSRSLINTITSGLNQAIGLAINRSGDLYAANTGNNTITEYNSSGTLIGTISDENTPYGLAINSSGDLYAANTGNNTITEYDSSGDLIGTISNASSGEPIFLAFGPASAVPEPSMLWLWCMGALICGGYAWRKKKLPRWCFVVFVGCGFAAGVSHADSIIYSNDFNGSSSVLLNGVAPTVDTLGNTWQAGTDFKNDGTVLNASGFDAGAFLAFTPSVGEIYTLSATVNPSAVSLIDWIGLGFSSSPIYPNGIFYGSADPWMLVRGNRSTGGPIYSTGADANDIVAFNAPDLEAEVNGIASPSGPVDLSIVLNTTAPDWSAEYYVNGVSVTGPLDLGTPDISYVGLGKLAGASGAVSDFVLLQSASIAVPEPSMTWLWCLGTLICGGYAWRRTKTV